MINGKTYSKDIIIYPDRVHSPWWRKEGHLLQTEDLSDIVNESLPILIVGTGYNGAMVVPKGTLEYLKSNNISVVVKKTQEAVDYYNKNAAVKQMAAAFHLTC
jgi:hypothetical protein